MLKKFWDTESIGVQDTPNDQEVKDVPFLQDIQFQGGRYLVKLPWKNDHPDVPDHFNLYFNRLKYLQQKLLKMPDVLKEYHSIQEQLANRIVEPVLGETGILPGNPCLNKMLFHYLPHRAVIRQDKATTKLRIVYDDSARSATDSLSLNDCLNTGPNLIPKLFNILIKFRRNLIAVTADIEKAFLMIGIHKADRDMLRFLWFKEATNADSEIIHLRFTRLIFGL